MTHKFRAWDKLNKRFIPEIFHDQILIDLNGVARWFSCNGLANVSGDTVIMQSTGIKDKNGVMIFDGDVLLGSIQSLYLTVEFINGCYCRKYKDGTTELLSVGIEDYMVIGNIWAKSRIAGG